MGQPKHDLLFQGHVDTYAHHQWLSIEYIGVDQVVLVAERSSLTLTFDTDGWLLMWSATVYGMTGPAPFDVLELAPEVLYQAYDRSAQDLPLPTDLEALMLALAQMA